MTDLLSFDNHCMYCLQRREKVKRLRPVYDWTDGKLIGYYCDDHYDQVRQHVQQQKEAYEQYNIR